MAEEMIQTDHGSLIGDVEFIWAKNSKEFLFANSIYVRGKPSFIIDPSATFTYLEKLAVTHSVDVVLNTHYHGDHRSLNSLFKNVIFASHEKDAPAIRDYQTYDKWCDDHPDSPYAIWRKQVFEEYHITDCPVSQLYKGNELIETDTTQIQLVHIPGHTPGHLALYFKNINCLYLSDIDLTPYGPWYANVVSDIDEFISSIDKVKKIKADYYVTSHGERIYTPEKFQERIDKFGQCFQERDQKILDLLKTGPKTIDELGSEGIVYRKMALVDPLKAYFQYQMIVKHLERLKKQGIIGQDEEHYQIK